MTSERSRFHKYMNEHCELSFHQADVEMLMESIDFLADCPPKLVEQMYSDYSERLSAGWMMVDEDEIRMFRNWLESEDH